MKKSLVSLLFLAFVLLGMAQTDSSQTNTKLHLEKGSVIRLSLLRDIGSRVAQEGNKVYFEVDSTVFISGAPVIPKGTKAFGTVTFTKQAESLGQKGTLAFSIDKIVMDDGRTIALTFDYKAAGRSRMVESITESLFLSYWFILKKGKDVTFQAGKKFIAYTLQDYQF